MQAKQINNSILHYTIIKFIIDYGYAPEVDELAKVWYGNHLNPDWKKWTLEEAKAIFDQFGLTSETWKIPISGSRF